MSIQPHGGVLVDCEADSVTKQSILDKLPTLPQLQLTPRQVSDFEMIAVGAFSPLTGFMTKADYECVVKDKHLASGLPWTIPITLAVSRQTAENLKEGSDVALYQDKHFLGVLHLTEKYDYDKRREAAEVYRTTDEAHPGVQALYNQQDVLLAGDITLVNHPIDEQFKAYRLTPRQTRAAFTERGWRRIVAFQTRNPVHRAHEYIQKCAMEIVDGLLLHPIVGETKSDDIPAEVRMKCYQVLLEKYYPPERTLLSVLPASMRYAGPREAIFHAIIRKNYGCTHFIVGRDHAGVGNYYGTYDAHYIFDEFDASKLGITPLFFEHTFFCRSCQSMASSKTCPHSSESHVILSGTKVREMLRRGEIPPVEFTRPEVAQVLIDALR
ncbi:MAG: sulfate adenylyltransferase [Acidobacteriota bacterium]|nr:sulfate adenylyltransferase [Blastocatellia bacterium]MDW8411270.1 sulfate adenylyltransferase [Acidobacteriota bacterium]